MACMVYSWFGSSRRCRLEAGDSQQTVVGQEKSHQGQRDTSSLQYGRLAWLGGRERERRELTSELDLSKEEERVRVKGGFQLLSSPPFFYVLVGFD